MPIKDRLDSSYKRSPASRTSPERSTCPPDRKFIGFDAYKQAMDCLKPGDVAIFATPLAFRWVHFTYAIEKGLNVFMEKPLSADGAASRRMLKLAEEATAKNLKVGVGLMSRHARPLQELHERIADGEIGDIILMRGYRMARPRRHLRLAAQARRTSATWNTRSAASTASSGPAAGASATSTSTSSTTSAG